MHIYVYMFIYLSIYLSEGTTWIQSLVLQIFLLERQGVCSATSNFAQLSNLALLCYNNWFLLISNIWQGILTNYREQICNMFLSLETFMLTDKTSVAFLQTPMFVNVSESKFSKKSLKSLCDYKSHFTFIRTCCYLYNSVLRVFSKILWCSLKEKLH